MTAKDKAKNIYNQMLEWVDDAHIYKERNIVCITAKQCALICVDELIDDRRKSYCSGFKYWEIVKEEINKL
mgnify:CR=1 FL=1